MTALVRNEGSKMTGGTKNKVKKLVCAGIVILALAGIEEARGRIADLDGDGNVSFSDYAIFANDWMKKGSGFAGDLNGDNIVDYNDLEILTRNWLKPNSKIAFKSRRDGNPEIYIMNPDGREQTRLTYNEITDRYPSWSPDNTKIVFSSGTPLKIHIMNIDGSNRINLDSTGWQPAWSPDGSKIAFTSYRDANTSIYVVNADGSNEIKLTDVFMVCNPAPNWSPDGKKIVYSHEGGIYTMNADGTNQTLIAENPYRPYEDPAFSPDGKKIAFRYGERYGMPPQPDFDSEIVIMNADGSNQIRLTDNNGWEAQPSWAPDGKKIVYVSDSGIKVIDINSGNQINLTTNGLIDSDPSWSSYLSE
jgi:Tol biopolymer transport system component